MSSDGAREKISPSVHTTLGIIFFAHMGVLHLLDFSDGTLVTGMCRQGEVPFWVMNMLMPLSTCMGSRLGLRVVKVMRPKFSVRVFDVIRPADGRVQPADAATS